MNHKTLLPIVVLISGNGTNLQAIIDTIQNGLSVEIRAVVSNKANAYGLQRAKQANIPTHLISHKNFPSCIVFEKVLQETIYYYYPQLIVLAGFMRTLGPEFISHYRGRIINIHPSLLPKYPGLHTHERALIAKDREHGVSIHYVTEDLDTGPLICQARLLITPKDTPETLKGRIHALEHVVYPEVLSWFADRRVVLDNHHIFLDGKLLPKAGKQFR